MSSRFQRFKRIDNAWRRRRGTELGRRARLTIALVTLAVCMLLAVHFGLVTLIARGYRLLAGVFLVVCVLPLMTVGISRLARGTAGLREQDAQDAVQEVFVRLSRRQDLSEIERIEGYLFETPANVVIDAVRHNRVRHSESHDVHDDSQHGRAECSSETAFEGQEAIERLLLGLRELPDRTRTIFILARLEDMRQSAIALRLGISVSAVEKRLTKGLAHLALRTGMP